MMKWADLLLRLRAVTRRKHMEKDLQEEIGFHKRSFLCDGPNTYLGLCTRRQDMVQLSPCSKFSTRKRM